MNKEALQSVIAALREGRTPSLSVEDFPCFSPEATEGNQHVDPSYLDAVARSLTADDIPTFERALRAMEEGDLAWLGFKIVYDADAAQRNTDNAVTKKYGDEGSADGEPLVFFCNDAKEIVASRPYSPRDTFQMKDVTRGPSMHNEQFEGSHLVERPPVRPGARLAAGRVRRGQRSGGARRPRGLRRDGGRLRSGLCERSALPCGEAHRARGRQLRRARAVGRRSRGLRMRAHARPHVRPRGLRLGREAPCTTWA